MNETIDGVEIRTFPRPAVKGPPHLGLLWERLHLARLMKKIVEEWKPNLVEAPDYRGESALFSRPGCPLVVRCHGPVGVLAPLSGKEASRLVYMMEGRALRRADHRVSVSEWLEEKIRKTWKGVGSAEIIPNFISTDVFKADPGVKRIPDRHLFVGRLSVQKGFPLLMRVMDSVLRRNPNATLDLVGVDSEGLLEDALSAMEPACRERVRHLGVLDRDKLASVYTNASFLLLPARAETFSLAVLEAMACGCLPVVFSDSGPGCYLKQHQVGFLVGQDEDWENVVGDLLARGESLDDERKAAASVVHDHFSADRVVALNEGYYKRVVEGNQ